MGGLVMNSGDLDFLCDNDGKTTATPNVRPSKD